MDKQKKLARLQKKESNLVYRGKKAVDEGRDNRADRLLKRAAKVENRVIKTSEKMKDGGPIINNKKVISKNSFSGTRDDGTSYKVKKRTVWDNKGTTENPVLTNQRSKTKTTTTDTSGKNKTFVKKTNSDGESKTRRAIIPVRKKGGITKSKKK
jgi:hypothetical protein